MTKHFQCFSTSFETYLWTVPSSEISPIFSNYGTVGRSQSGSGGGMASMMDEMQKTLARRRAKVGRLVIFTVMEYEVIDARQEMHKKVIE